MTGLQRLRAVGLLCLLAACNGGGEESTDSGETDGTSDTGTPTTSGTPTTTGEGDTGTGGLGECDPAAQDCPEGSKCTAFAEKGEKAWTANKCVPVMPNAPGLNETCEVMGENAFSGIDNCAEGFICLNVDSELKDGFCVEFCDPAVGCDTSAGDRVCVPSNDGALPVCLATCDPLVQDCQGRGGCYGDPAGPPFICFNPDPVGGGMDGDPCSFANACLAGLNCVIADALEGCNTPEPGCCSPFCGLDEMACMGAEECLPFFETPQPGFENVGICTLPG